jgi:hypothetical protein
MAKLDYERANALARGRRDHDYLADWQKQQERASFKKPKKPEKPKPLPAGVRLSKREVEHMAFMRRTQKGLLSLEVAAYKAGQGARRKAKR